MYKSALSEHSERTHSPKSEMPPLIALPFLCKLHIHAPSPWPIFHAGKWPTGRVESSKSLANQEWSETQMLFQPPQFINCYLLQPVTPSVMLQFTMLLAFVAKLVSESLTLTNQPATLLQNHIGEAPNPAWWKSFIWLCQFPSRL